MPATFFFFFFFCIQEFLRSFFCDNLNPVDLHIKLFGIGMTICFNPSPMSADLPKQYPLHLVDYLLINEIEAQELYLFLTASDNNNDDSSSSSPKITAAESFPVLEKAYGQTSGIIITLGGDGLVARFRINEEDKQMEEFRMGVVESNVVNTTGVRYILKHDETLPFFFFSCLWAGQPLTFFLLFLFFPS